MMLRTLLVLAVFLLLFAGCDSDRPRLQSGDPAPGFTLVTLDGERIALQDLRGQVVALRFWADWCPYCHDEMRALEPVHQRRATQGLAILAVNVGQDQATAERFIQRLGISYRALLDDDSTVARSYGVIGLPTTVFIDRDGLVRGKILGESDAAVFEGAVERLLHEADDEG